MRLQFWRKPKPEVEPLPEWAVKWAVLRDLFDSPTRPSTEVGIEAVTQRWHQGHGEGMELHEYLGWTWAEYQGYHDTRVIPPSDVLTPPWPAPAVDEQDTDQQRSAW